MSDKKIECRYCKGSGSVLCTVCKGSRKDPRNPESECRYCRGTGVIQCSACLGKGYTFE